MSAVSRTAHLLVALVATVAVSFASPGTTSAHPLGNFTVNRALAITVSDVVEVLAVLDMAEIPAFEIIRDLDTDGDDAVSATEGDGWADDACEAWRTRIEVAVDDATAALRTSGEPQLSFPAGAGGLPTLRLECRWILEPAETEVRISIRDTTVGERIGWREVVACAAGTGTIQASDVPASSETDLLRAYPDDRLASPPDVRSADLTVSLGSGRPGASGAGPEQTTDDRGTGADPLAALIGGELSPLVVLLALVLSLGLGAAHALSPGHGKTLVAAYVLGAGGTARAAVQIGLWVAISHTAGVFVLGVVTLAASEWLLPEALIGWLSLASGVIVSGLGIVLLARVAASRGWLRARPNGHASVETASPHHHGADHPHAHPADHDHGGHHHHHHEHEHNHEHGHGHHVPTAGELSWRTAIALGFAGGAVPSASALIVLLVAVSTDRLLLGAVLIGAFGIGMAAVLGGLAFAIARMRHLAAGSSGIGSRPIVRRALAAAPVAAGAAVLVTGIAFTATALSQLA